MSLDSLNDAVNSMGGSWYKLYLKDDHAPIEGQILDFQERDRTDTDGDVVYKKGTTTPRKEWVFTLQTSLRDPDNNDDDGIRKISLNESGQRAVAKAIKESGEKAALGGTLKVGVRADAPDKFSQAEYIARYTPPAKTIAVDVDLEDF